MGRSASPIITRIIVLLTVLVHSLLCATDPSLAHHPNGITPEVDTPATQESVIGDETSKDERSYEQREAGRGDWFGITQAVSKYIASYTSTATTRLQLPYFGVSAAVAMIIVFFVIIYILIIVSGAVVVNGRDVSGRQGKLDAPSGDREQLTHAIMKAIDREAAKFAESQPLDNEAAGPNHIGLGASGLFKRRPKREAEENGRQINAYVSGAVYNVLTWLSKPFMGYFVVLAAVILYMIVIVQIAITSNVFPLASLGRTFSRSLNFVSSYDYLEKTAYVVMKAINEWERRDSGTERSAD